MELQNCESQEELQQLAMTFTASRANFGALETVELERGGEGREVTLENKAEFVNKLFKWHLTGISAWHSQRGPRLALGIRVDGGSLSTNNELASQNTSCWHFDCWAS